MSPTAHSSWGPGWPSCQPSKIKTDFVVSGTRFPGGIRFEIADLTGMLVQECKNRGYRFGTSSDPSYGCWGYSCRCISGSNTPSNHSWGLAVDINAPSNPYTSPLVTDMPSWMPDLWNEYGYRWGGDYSGSKDAMHYEFMGSVNDAANETANARAAGLGGGGVTPPPQDWFDMATQADLEKAVANQINALVPGIVNDVTASVLRAQEFLLTNGSQRTKVAFYKVYRHDATQIDYAAGPGRFKFIRDPQDYDDLYRSGWINIAHDGDITQVVDTKLLQYIRAEASVGAGPGAIDDII